MFYVPLAQNVRYKDPLMKRVELQSHFIGGCALLLMRGLHMDVSAVGVARNYRDFLDVMVIDEQDAHQCFLSI